MSLQAVIAPHCDHRVLHAPGACQFCDEYPERQAGRIAAMICFTGEDPELKQGGPWISCPSDAFRGLAGAHVWEGNRPVPGASSRPDCKVGW